MKEKFDAYVLWTLVKRVQNLLVDRSTARDLLIDLLVEISIVLLCKLLQNKTIEKSTIKSTRSGKNAE